MNNTEFAFISLSDLVYIPSDSVYIPFPDISDWPKDSAFKFLLPSETRKDFLKKASISENEKVWIFDYKSNNIWSAPVKSLALVAVLNPYDNWEEGGFEVGDYMIGFQLDLSKFPVQNFDLINSLATINKVNIFMSKGLSMVSWIPGKAVDFANQNSTLPSFWRSEIQKNAYFTATYNEFQIDVHTMTKQSNQAYHYTIRNKVTGELMDDFLVQSSESCEPAPLNLVDPNFSTGNQWIGSLIKGQPPVLLGLEYYSFSCPKIHVLKKGIQPWILNCDCRH